MARKLFAGKPAGTPSAKPRNKPAAIAPRAPARPSALLDTRVIYCGDCLEQLKNLPAGCIDLIYIDPPFNSNRNYEVFWGARRGEPASMDDFSRARQSASS